MNHILLFSSLLLLSACQEQTTAPVVDIPASDNSVTIKLDSAKRTTLINELSKIMSEQPDGISVSGLVLKQEKGADNISRITMLSDSGKIITLPYEASVKKDAQLSLTYTVNADGDTSVTFLMMSN